MFEGMKDMGKLLKQAKDMKSKMKEVQSQLKSLHMDGSAESGKIRVTLTGELDCTAVEIDPSLLNEGDKKRLEKGLLSAFNMAAKESKNAATSRLSGVTGDLKIPGL